MRNFRQHGDAVYVPAPVGDVKSGDFIVVGTLYGVCGTDAVYGTPVALWNKGVFNLPKVTGTGWTIGEVIYWDSVQGKALSTTNTNTTKIGVATALAPGYTAAAASADAFGDVRLNSSFQ